jgi:hypothetical protein
VKYDLVGRLDCGVCRDVGLRKKMNTVGGETGLWTVEYVHIDRDVGLRNMIWWRDWTKEYVLLEMMDSSI